MKQACNKSIILISLILFMVASIQTEAQNDTFKSEYQKEFNQFLKSSQYEYSAFLSKNDSIYYHFLLKSWKEFKLFKETRSEMPKPVEQPVLTINKQNINNKIIPTIKHKSIPEDSGRQIRYNNVPEEYNHAEYTEEPANVNFYNNNIRFPKIEIIKLSENDISEKQIAVYFKQNANNKALYNTAQILKQAAFRNKFNSYGYLTLLQQTAAKYLPDINNQVLFVWLALVKTGFDAKVGYDNNTVYLLVNFDVPVYSVSYFVNEGKKYYLLPFAGQKKVSRAVFSFPQEYPARTQPVSLIITALPIVANNIKTRTIRYNNRDLSLNYNSNLVSYYNTYPECELSIYFIPDLSNDALKSFDNLLVPLLKDKTKTEQINLLLDFIQKGFPYETDEKQFGKEKYFFAEEMVALPYSDCEDRAILLSRLISHFTKLKTIGLVFPGHVSLAVAVHNNVSGTYVEYENIKYYIADPTYIGSKLGMIMPEYAHSNPKIIDIY